MRAAGIEASPCKESFNPRLPLPGGDALSRPSCTACGSGFNPRLPLPGGDAGCRRVRAGRRTCFNPRLPLPGGDAWPLPGSPPCCRVSIHASRCREAMLVTARDDALAVNLFQSTPPVAGRRCGICAKTSSGTSRFNPRLPLPGGDAMGAEGRETRGMCFNPRLPLPGGDALREFLVRLGYPVSIHASRCREAMLGSFRR